MLNAKIVEALTHIDLKITELEKHKELAILESSSINKKDISSISVEEFDQLRIKENMLSVRLDRINIELESLEVEKRLLLQPHNSATFERIIIGSGIAGTAVFLEVNSSTVNSASPNVFPPIVVLNNPANHQQWRKDGTMLMGQPAAIQTPQVFSHHSEDFAADNEVSVRNPYNYVLSDHFDHALVSTQAAVGMKILNLAAEAIESKDSYAGSVVWEHDEYAHRICVNKQGINYYLYTHHIDLCTGPGSARKLKTSQIPVDLEKKLVQEDIILYGQDCGDKKLHGNVVFYGGGARNAAIILDILSGQHPEVSSFTWIAINGENFDTNAAFNRMFKDLDADPRCKMALAELTTIEQQGNAQLKLTFGAPQKPRKGIKIDNISAPLLCDQLVVSIGQEVYPLVKKLKGFVPCLLENTFPGVDDESETIPVGTYSADRSIIAWGAAGAMGTGLYDTSKFIDAVTKHAQTLPRESRATVGIFRSSWTIKMMAKILGINEESKVHSYDLPDINVATRRDLYDIIIANMINLDPKECLKMVDHIIEVRSKQAVGLSNLSILKPQVPDAVIAALMQEYFPFDITPVMTSAVKVHSTASGATFFGGRVPAATDGFAKAIAVIDKEDVLLPEITAPTNVDGEDDDLSLPPAATVPVK